jgi:hypothetical protein
MVSTTTTTMDTCTTVDTSDFMDHSASASCSSSRCHSRLSRSSSQGESSKRARILVNRNSRHSLDDEPQPLEEPDNFADLHNQLQSDPQSEQLEASVDWSLESQQSKVYHHVEVEEEEEEDADEDEQEDEEEEEEDPRTLIGEPVNQSPLLVKKVAADRPKWRKLVDKITST